MDFTETTPIYMQIAERLMDSIVRGRYQADARIPSVRETAAEVEVNANTVARSYDRLQQQGVIYNRRGVGYFVSPEAVRLIADLRRKRFFDHEACQFFERLHSFGITPEALAVMYNDYLHNTPNQ